VDVVMRMNDLAIACALLVAACSPDIAPGAYLCGVEQLCPEGMACNGPDNTCVFAENALPFECGFPDPAGDDVPGAGHVITGLNCVSPIRESRGCLFPNDPADWFELDVPNNCVAVQLEVRITFPLAFEHPALELATDGGVPERVDGPCASGLPPDDGETARCFKRVVENGSHHAIGVTHSGDFHCGGGCAHTRYRLEVQLSTP
jgi:hypothetical protein